MQRTYRVPLAWAGLVGLMAMLVLLAHPGTSIAGGPSESGSAGGATQTASLQRGSGYGAAAAETGRVRALQRTLRRLGWQPGPVDGRFGPRTEAAVLRFQQATGLAADGIVGAATRRALKRERSGPLRRGAGYAEPNGSPRVRALQVRLHRRGLRPGPVDGVFGPRTEAALTRFQRRGGLPANGVATVRTRRLLSAGPTAPKPVDTEPQRPRERRRLAASVGTATGGATQPEVATGTVDLPLLIAVALIAALAGMLAGALSGRLRKATPDSSMPLTHAVLAEGEARDPSIGWFRGRVLALVSGQTGLWRRPEVRYLVDDPRKDGSFWVSHREVKKLVAPPSPEGKGKAPRRALRVIGYVSAQDGEPSAMEDQMQAIDSFCEQREWKLVEVVRDEEGSAADPSRRPGLRYALERIDRGDGVCLVVAELGALSRSAVELDAVLERLGRTNSRLVALDLGLDTGTPGGEVAVRALRAVGSWQPAPFTGPGGLASTRTRMTREAIADVPALKERIRAMRAEGMTLRAIADRLNSERVPTLRGGREWRPSSVQTIAGYRRPRRNGNGGGNGGGP